MQDILARAISKLRLLLNGVFEIGQDELKVFLAALSVLVGDALGRITQQSCKMVLILKSVKRQ